MCGISGIIDFEEPISPNDLVSMCHIMHHRGPDYNDIWMDKYVGLAHNRLSIIDPSSMGNQPMQNETGDFCISYNGIIYNYKTLRSELQGRHHFISQTDTEVLLHLWEDKHIKIFDKLNGIFAFAIWDKKKQCITLARDHLGIKPLYYWHNASRLIFASEIKALLTAGIPKEINLIAVAEYFSFQNLFHDKTFFKDIFLLPAGNYLQFDRNGLR